MSKIPAQIPEYLTRVLEDTATEIVCDFLATAEEAALKGRAQQADYWMYCAERMALRSGSLVLISLVWRHSPLAKTILP